ncbi:NADH-quinone oxidoreductase subunit F [Ectothiorhodospiraceae bacterium BW-2]|nr:NADH-quinone oxidoreductase subunit F [Ectothiorhodospiraceae bacterium BW-2]
MVNALLIIAVALGTAFLLGLLPDHRRNSAYLITLAALLLMGAISGQWLLYFADSGGAAVQIFTAGHLPPFSIALSIGLAEAAMLTLICLFALMAAIYLRDTLYRMGRRAMAVLLIFTMAAAGIILTRDLFNLFVFIELMVIATAGLILLTAREEALSAGFKYLIAAQVVSIMLLIGLIFAYHATGTLNIDEISALPTLANSSMQLALFLMFIAIIIELKPFPANGWGLDIYQSAHPAFAALFSVSTGAAMLFAVDKMVLMGGDSWLPLLSAIGVTTFVAANLLGLSQQDDRRLLGYSSIGQLGLLLLIIGQRDLLGDQLLFIAGGVLVAQAIAKAGLFWLSGLIERRELSAWSVLRRHPLLIFAFASFIALLIGLPPFPGFYAKWELVHALAAGDRLLILGLMLFGSLLEATYLFRWFGYVLKREPPPEEVVLAAHKLAVVFATLLAGWGVGYLWGELSNQNNLLHALPLLFALSFLLLEWLPVKVKNSLAIAGMVGWFLLSYQEYNPLQLIYAIIILVGGPIILLASYHAHGRRLGFYPATMLMYAGLAMLIVAEDSFTFFAAWELLTIGSYYLILRGAKSEPHALSYLAFSLGGAFLILTGFALAGNGETQMALTTLSSLSDPVAPWVFLLLAIGFMTKTAAAGLHIWLPGAHAEAETDVSPMVSGILLKAGLFGLMMLLLNMGKQQLYGLELTHLLLWIGALSALIGNLMAAFQEDAKRLLAYSSIGQMGYALFGLALMNHLGWLMALMFVINHYIYKSMLFLSIGGVAKRTGTRLMYQMGGLITLMPLSFIAVLIGIIAVSGVPPLSGFGGRWIFYNAIMSAEYRLPIVIIFLAGPIAFLYLFRLIHTIFLGQLKDEHRKIKEAPFWIVVPQMIFVVLLLIFALVPGLALRRVDEWLVQYFADTPLGWEGLTITSPFGYWSPISIMIIIGVIFMTLFSWLLFVNRRAQKVKQFNIVFSAERPYRPETTHFAWNFFAPYRKALGFLTLPLATRFWQTVTDLLHTLADFVRRIYDGSGQSYAIHLVAFIVVVFLLQGRI